MVKVFGGGLGLGVYVFEVVGELFVEGEGGDVDGGFYVWDCGLVGGVGLWGVVGGVVGYLWWENGGLVRELGRGRDGGMYGGYEYVEYIVKSEICVVGYDGFGVVGFYEILELWEMGLVIRCVEKSMVRRRCLLFLCLDYFGVWVLVVLLMILIFLLRGYYLCWGICLYCCLGSLLMWLCLGGLLRERWDKEERNWFLDLLVVRLGIGKGEWVLLVLLNWRWVGLVGILKVVIGVIVRLKVVYWWEIFL